MQIQFLKESRSLQMYWQNNYDPGNTTTIVLLLQVYPELSKGTLVLLQFYSAII